MAASSRNEPKTAAESAWGSGNKADDLEYMTELALHEAKNWIQLVTSKAFPYPGDFRRSLENGVLLCELLNGLRPDTIRKINRLPSPIAGLDNINVFLECCQTHFGLKDSQLFHSCDLEDLSIRAVSDDEDEYKLEADRRLRNVAITIFWLGKVSRKYNFYGPQLDLGVFASLVHGSSHSAYLLSPPPTPSIPSLSPSLSPSTENVSRPGLYLTPPRTPSLSSQAPSTENLPTAADKDRGLNESFNSVDRSSAYGSYRSETKNSEVSVDDVSHSRDEWFDSVRSDKSGTSLKSDKSTRSDKSVTSDYHEDTSSVGGSVDNSVSMPVRHDFRRSGAASGTASGGLGATHGQFSASMDVAYDPRRYDNNNKSMEFEPLSADQRSSSNTSLDKHIQENDMLHSRLGARKSTGANANPLQFIKAGTGGTPLAEQAKETVEVMEKQKEQKKVIETMEEDWQSNLSSWKNKMRKKSAPSMQRAQESEEFQTTGGATGKGGEEGRKAKTFKEMMEEREKRKSGGGFYPSEDQDDDPFTAPKSHDSRSLQRDNNSDTLTAFGFHKVDDPTPASSSSLSRRSHPLNRTLDDDQRGGSGFGGVRSDRMPQYGAPVFTTDAQSGYSERKSVSEEQEAKEEVAPWAMDEAELEKQRQKQQEQQQKDSIKEQESIVPQRQSSISSSSSFRGGTATYPQPQYQRDSTDQQTHSFTKIKVQHEQSSAPGNNNTESGYNTARDRFENRPDSNTDSRIKPMVSPRSEFTETQEALPKQEVMVTRTVRKSYEVQQDERETERKIPSRQSSQTDKKHIEKMLKISQKPNHTKGFGFTIRGGKEFSSPIVVEKVILGGAADVCELMPGDEIVAINGASVSNHYKDSVELVINQAVRLGQIELKIRRSLANLGLMDQEDLQMEQEQKQLRSSSNVRIDTTDSRNTRLGGDVVVPPAPWEKSTPPHSPPSTAPKPAPKPATKPSAKPTQSPAPWDKKTYSPVTPPWTPPQQQQQTSHEIIVERTTTTQTQSAPSQAPPPSHRPSSPDKPDSVTMEDEQLEREIMEQLETEDDGLINAAYQSRGLPERPSTPEPKDEPPPLPDAPPPVPNWGTCPGAGGPPDAPPVDLSHFDASDLVPDTADHNEAIQRRSDLQTRMENLRRKSEFLGRNMEDTEEYHKLQEELRRESENKDEETEWQKIEQKEYLSASNLMSRFDKIPTAVTAPEPEIRKTHEIKVTHERTQSEPYPAKTSYDISREQQEVIERLEQVGRDCQNRQDEIRREEQQKVHKITNSWNTDQMKGWKSMEQLRSPGMSLAGDAQETPWQYSTERDYMTEEQFDRDQERMNQQHEDDLKRVEIIEIEKKKEEEKLLEKDLLRQRELEDLKEKRDKERERKKREEEEYLHKERLAEAAAAAEREKRAAQEKKRKEDEALQEQLQKERKAERERLRQEEEEKKRKEAESKRLEAERKAREAELKKQEAELKRQEEEQRRRDEAERQRRREQELEEKAKQLRMMEERLQQEEEALRKKRELIKLEQSQISSNTKTDEVTTTYAVRPDSMHRGDFEYVYKGDSPSPLDDLMSAAMYRPDQALTQTTERTERFDIQQAAPQQAEPQQTNAKKVPPILPKPSIKSELSGISRKDIMDMNRHPGASAAPSGNGSVGVGVSRNYEDTYTNSSPQTRVRMEARGAGGHRKSWSPDTAASELTFIKKHPDLVPPPRQYKDLNGGTNAPGQPVGMSRQEMLALNRKVFARKDYASGGDIDNYEPPPSPTGPAQPMTRKDLHSLGAPPKSRVMSSEKWIRDDVQKPPRRSEVMRQSLTSLSEHWLVEEAERRRIAEQTGAERPNVPNTNRQGDQEYSYGDNPENLEVLAPPKGYGPSQLSRSWQGSREHTPSRNSPARSVGGRGDSPQTSAYSYSQKESSMSTFRAPNQGLTHITEIEKPEFYAKPQRPIPDDIKQSLLDRVNNPASSQSSSSYGYPQGPAPGTASHSYSSQYSDPNDAYPVRDYNNSSYVQKQNTYPGRQTNRPHESSPHTRPVSAHYNHPGYQDPRIASHDSRIPPHHASGPNLAHPARQDPRIPPHHISDSRLAHPHSQPPPPPSSSGSVHSWDRGPPVPPKPPRLMSSDSEESFAEQVVSVSGSQACSHCDSPLGHGAAMVIESLGLYYHMPCFRCCVCQTALSTGHAGADVRVRVSKLHCVNCYSNDEVGLKYSRV